MQDVSHKKPLTRMTLRGAKVATTQTDWRRLRNMSDTKITRSAEADADNLPLDDPFFETARHLPPSALLKEAKQQITLRIEPMCWNGSARPVPATKAV
jgi:hypothetical protein